MNPAVYRGGLERLYRKYNRRRYVHPDPVEFLYPWKGLEDREIVGLAASSLAYGGVRQILRSVEGAMARLGPEPALYVRTASLESLERDFEGFRHRFTSGRDMARLLFGAGRVLERFGSLEACLAAGLAPGHDTVAQAMEFLVARLAEAGGGRPRMLLASPCDGSACKRLSLLLRWMTRRDAVDPGGWTAVPASKLIVPLDTHMHRLCLTLGLTTRKSADFKAALEVTAAFRRISPHDPVRYDFALTRLGIRRDIDAARELRALKPLARAL